MKRIVKSCFMGKKCKYLNFVAKPEHGDFCSVALAFPVSWVDGERLDDPSLLDSVKPGAEVNVIWSKKLGSYVVRF